MKNKIKKLLDNIFIVFKFIALFIAAIIMGILNWWPMITIGIVISCLIAFLSVTVAWIIFGILFSLVLLILIIQIFTSRTL